ncbi:biotin-dependent carboxyltransferase family protein [Verticiella sediminum]|uniref:Biotin-dependent carboxyltransferase family protein n=2 Tax=Verticiella sediminum TaxID=1247510 RepID=A0A556AUQ3_9BURK|nr:biotin-dependent carboxyltransferase family protein [Verticiella sediminum]
MGAHTGDATQAEPACGLRVIKSGPLSLLQDGGRRGWQHIGVSPAGPMDPYAAAWANRLLDNPRNTSVVEMALGGVAFAVEVDTWLAVTGADMPLTLDGRRLAGWSRFAVRRGQHLVLGYARWGQRAYLAAVGGFAATPVLGSVATHVQDGLGGLHGDGAPLRRDDWLACAPAPHAHRHRARPVAELVPDYARNAVIRVIPNLGEGAFEPDAMERFYGQPWEVSVDSDRKGIRLKGERPLSAPARQWSQGMVWGAIQVPPDGQPIVLAADRQTMGGYPVIGFVHPLDFGRVCQARPKEPVRFLPTTQEEAEADLRASTQLRLRRT